MSDAESVATALAFVERLVLGEDADHKPQTLVVDDVLVDGACVVVFGSSSSATPLACRLTLTEDGVRDWTLYREVG